MTDGNIRNPLKVLIVGDVMLDRFEYGLVRRISPEAPVPVLLHRRTKSMLGGAGNVAVNVRALDAEPTLIALIGKDSEGRELKGLLKSGSVKARLFETTAAPTIVKTRFIAGTNHILRVDREADPSAPYVPQAKFKSDIGREADRSNVILISDYGKGFVSSEVCRVVIDAAVRHHIPVLVDPKCDDYAKYAGATLIKPNLREFSQATGKRFDPRRADFTLSAVKAGRALCKRCHIGALLVTLSEYGMLYIPGDARIEPIRLSTEAREVYDVSGAGDTTLAALAVALSEGKDMEEAMHFANAAAGVVVAKLGTANATKDEIKHATQSAAPTNKILSRAALKTEISHLRRSGKRIGFTNGCFDCCHLGHLTSLLEARRLCDILVVGINSDEWITKHKGPGRPIQDEATRTALLAALSCVDYVTVFSEKTSLPLVKALHPDVIAKEGYSISQWPEGRYVRSYGGKAIVLKRVAGYSTSDLVAKMEKSSR